jgi:hypothetical protein
MTTGEFERIVKEWIATAKHPKTGRLYTEMAYQPMLELLTYLRANGFKTFIVSGGGIEFMRPWTEKVYGIPPEQVVGSSGKTQFEMRDGKRVLNACLSWASLTTAPASRSESTCILVAVPFLPSAIPMVTCRCSNGPPPAVVRASWVLSITRTPCANGPTAASRASESSTRRLTKRRQRAAPSCHVAHERLLLIARHCGLAGTIEPFW